MAPLIMMLLLSFTKTPTVAQQQVYSKDSTIVSVQFTPAQLILKDNRDIVNDIAIVSQHTESNLEIANSITQLTSLLSVDMKERRSESLVDRISQQTGLSIITVTSIIHKKRVFDMVAYTIFIVFLLYMYYAFSTFSNYSRMMNISEFKIKTISYIILFVILVLLFKYGDGLINGNYHPLIETIIKAPPG